jgi:signal transduction histidine kinase
MSNRFYHKFTNTRFIAYVVFTYVIAQFLWWEVLMVRLHTSLYEEKQNITALSVASEEELNRQLQTLESEKKKKILMIVGEGTIFLLILLYGVVLIRKSQRREAALLSQKNNFLLSITHELKTPLTTTKLQLQTLKKHQLSPEKKLEIIDLAIQENDRLNVLIDNVLLATRMQQDSFGLVPEKINLSDFVTDLLSRTYSQELQKGILKTEIENNVYVMMDKIAFPSIILNLIDNAFKYSFEEMNIRFKLRKINDGVTIEVSDSGIGISDNEKGEVFNRFYRSGNEEIRRTKGTGLGLFIVKFLTEKHKGTISVKDNEPKGSVFVLNFPAA